MCGTNTSRGKDLDSKPTALAMSAVFGSRKMTRFIQWAKTAPVMGFDDASENWTSERDLSFTTTALDAIFLSSQEFAPFEYEEWTAYNIQSSVATTDGFDLQPTSCVPRREARKKVATNKIYITLSISVIVEVEITPVSVSLQRRLRLFICHPNVG